MQAQGLTGEERFRQLLEAHLKSSDHIMDLGCGEGTFTLTLAALARKVTGVDLSRQLIDTAKIHLQQSGVANVAFVHAAGQDLLFPENSVDMMVSRRGPLGLSGFLEEARRVVRPGGILLEVTVGEHDAKEAREWLSLSDSDPTPGKKERLKERIEQNGYRLVELAEVTTLLICKTALEVAQQLRATRMVGEQLIQTWTERLEKHWDQHATADGFSLTHHRIVWMAINEK